VTKMRKDLAAAATLPQLPRWQYLGYFAGALAVQFTWGLTAVATRYVQVSKHPCDLHVNVIVCTLLALLAVAGGCVVTKKWNMHRASLACDLQQSVTLPASTVEPTDSCYCYCCCCCCCRCNYC
jgi:hypothetical protein